MAADEDGDVGDPPHELRAIPSTTITPQEIRRIPSRDGLGVPRARIELTLCVIEGLVAAVTMGRAADRWVVQPLVLAVLDSGDDVAIGRNLVSRIGLPDQIATRELSDLS